MNTVQISKLTETSIVPSRKHPHDAGLDLYADLPDGLNYYVIEPFKAVIISAGISINIPEGYVGLIWPKSKTDYLIGGGVVDAGYQGPILVKIINPLDAPVTIKQGQAIAQFLIQKIETPVVVTVSKDELFEKESARASSGGITTQYKTATLQSPITDVE